MSFISDFAILQDMKYLFIDESGDHNLLPNKIDPQFPLFVLTGIVFDSKEYKKFQKEIKKFKLQVFGNEKIILHSKELTRPNITKQKELGALTNKEKRKEFYLALNKLIAKTNFSILLFVIDKPWFAKTFGVTPPDPYFLSFANILSEYETQLRINEKGRVIVEQRSRILDKQFLLAWESARVSRVGLVEKEKLKAHQIEKPEIKNKSWDENGLELADLISYRLSRNFMNKQVKPLGNEIDLRVINTKQMLISSFTPLPNASKK